MQNLQTLLNASTERHHHQLCQRQVLGMRMGMYAAELFGLDLPQVDKRLFGFVETDGCLIDGLAVATGCWVGNRTMRVMAYGKGAATFGDTQAKQAIRISPSAESRTRALEYAPTAPDRWHAQLAAYQVMPAKDAEAISYLQQAITSGKHWYIALLEAIGLWTSAEETHNGRTYRYLIDGEAFDWMLLAERLCEAVDRLLPKDEREAFLFHGIPPLRLSPAEVKGLIGSSKYRQYLNYFYGITVEEALIMSVQAEIHKERRASGYSDNKDTANEAYRRIYGSTRAILLRRFRKEGSYPQLRSTSLTELKEFTYWLFKYRLAQSEKAKIASDTKKALDYLRRQWVVRGLHEALITEETLAGRRP